MTLQYDVLNQQGGAIAQEFKKTAVFPSDEKTEKFLGSEGHLPYLCVKMSGEMGEVADLIGKWMRGDPKYQDLEVLRAALEEELGDFFWYFMVLLDTLGLSLGDMVSKTVMKLHKRATGQADRGLKVE